MKKILFSLAAVVFGAVVMTSCGNKAVNEENTEDSVALAAQFGGEGSSTFEAVKARLTSDDAKANLEALVEEIKANGDKYNAAQLVEARMLLDELVEKAKNAEVSVEDITAATEKVTEMVGDGVIEKAKTYLSGLVASGDAVQQAAVGEINDQIDAAKAAGEEAVAPVVNDVKEKVNEGKAVVEKANQKVAEANQKVAETKQKVDETKQKVDNVKESAKKTNEAVKNVGKSLENLVR